MKGRRRRVRGLGRGGLALVALGVAVLGAIAVAPMTMELPGPRLPLRESPRDYGLAFDEVELRPRDQPITLRAWWMPAARPTAALVMVHGGGEDNRTQPYSNGLALARDLVQRGYGILALDLRNYGESDASRTGQVTFGDEEANDVVAALDWLDGAGLGLPYGALGASMGGATVIYAAARDPRLTAVVTDGTFGESRAIAGNFVHAATGLPSAIVVPFLWSAEWLHGAPLGRGRAIDVVAAIAPRRALFICNEADAIVPLEDCRRVAAALPGAETWIAPAPPADHPLRWSQGLWGMHVQSYKLYPEEYVTRVTRFLAGAFGARPRV